MTASATGVTPSASFNLTNQIQPTFSGLTGQTITYGSTVTFTGTLAAGSQVPAGEEVAVTVDGVTHDATIASDGSFSTQFSRADVVLNASSTAYNVTYDYATDGVFLAADGSSQLTVNPAPLTITAVANTKVYDGTTTAAAVPTITSGSLATGDTADFTETYSTKNVGTGLTLTPSGTVDDGNGGNNYTYTFVPVSTGVITPARADHHRRQPDQGLRRGAAVPDRYLRRLRRRRHAASLATPPSLLTTATDSSPVVSTLSDHGRRRRRPQLRDHRTRPGTLTVTPATPTLSVSPRPAAPTTAARSRPRSRSVGPDPPAASLEDVTPVLTYYAGSGTSGSDLGSTPPVRRGPTRSWPVPRQHRLRLGPVVAGHLRHQPVPPRCSLGLSGSSSVFGQAVTLVAASPAPSTPGGSVTFSDGSNRSAPSRSMLGQRHADHLGAGGRLAHAHGRPRRQFRPRRGFGGVHGVGLPGRDPGRPGPAAGLQEEDKLVSLGLKAKIQPIAPGAGVPTGTVAFEIQKK